MDPGGSFAHGCGTKPGLGCNNAATETIVHAIDQADRIAVFVDTADDYGVAPFDGTGCCQRRHGRVWWIMSGPFARAVRTKVSNLIINALQQCSCCGQRSTSEQPQFDCASVLGKLGCCHWHFLKDFEHHQGNQALSVWRDFRQCVPRKFVEIGSTQSAEVAAKSSAV